MLAAISAACAAKILVPSDRIQGHVESMIAGLSRLLHLRVRDRSGSTALEGWSVCEARVGIIVSFRL